MADLTVAIIGLGRLGASVGLALKAYNAQPDAANHFTVVGADLLTGQLDEAKDLGAIDKSVRFPADAAAGADLIVLAPGYADLKTLYEEMASGLRAGAVLMDLAPLKMPSIEWAKDYLPGDAYLVGVTLTVNPAHLFDGLDDTAHATADLFEGGDGLIMPGPGADSDAVDLVSTLVGFLGAKPRFVDPAEHDGLIASTEGLAALLGVASFYGVSTADGWAEAQRVTNADFGRLTHHLLDTHPDDLRDLLLNNRQNLVFKLDVLLNTLHDLRDALHENDRDTVEEVLVRAEERYATWLRRRSSGDWDAEEIRRESGGASIGGGLMRGVLGGFLADRLGKNNNRKG